MDNKWINTYNEVVKFLDTYDKDRKFNFQGHCKRLFENLVGKLKDEFIEYVLGDEVNIAYKWINILSDALRKLQSTLNIKGTTFPKEFKRFIDDPRGHLKRKIFNYLYDLLRNKITVDEFTRRAQAAITTSFRTNLRSLYQYWVFISLLNMLGSKGAKLVYPEHLYLPLDRSGKQKTGTIPPNTILFIEDKGYLSFFLEAPRPIGWEDTDDLKRSWSFYVALRPDIMVYSGLKMNIIDLNNNPPIAKPDIIIECKELDDWFIRVRDMRGQFAKPLTAEEWRSRWIEGLWEGLAEAMGVQRAEVEKRIKEKKSIRLREDRIVKLYKKVYNPKLMFLVSRAKIPVEVKQSLERDGITVIDDVGFNSKKLIDIVKVIEELASFSGLTHYPLHLRLPVNLYTDLLRLVKGLKHTIGRDLPIEDLIVLALKYILENKEEFMKYIEGSTKL